jgi:hypothetical protein
VRNLVSTRPGYESIDSDVEVAAGTRFELELTLQRSSAVLLFSLQPSEAEILMDGQVAVSKISKPSASEKIDESAEGAEVPDVAEVMIGGLLSGSHTLELRLEGYRPKRIGFDVEDVRDYSLPDLVALEVTRGEVTVTDIPADAVLVIDGLSHGAASMELESIKAELAPGEHLVQVEAGSSGRFEEVITVADQDVLTVPVRLRPVVVLLGVLGDDGVAAPALKTRLRDSLGNLDTWYLFDRSSEAGSALESLNVSARTLRETRDQKVAGSKGPDWVAVQKAIDKEFKAPVFLLAVLSDDLFATSADLWIWAAEPYPSQPSIRRIELEDSTALDEVVASFEEIMTFERPSFGASLIDSDASDAPVVIDLSENGPGAQAGLKIGDRLLTVDGQEISSSRQFQASVQSHRQGDELSVEVENSQGKSLITVKLAAGPAVLSPSDSNLLLPVASAKLANEIRRLESGHPEWLLKLNQAAILLHAGAWREAVPLLRTVDASSDSPLGKAAVDYWLGRALMGADPVAYRERAREAYSRAAEDLAGRLYHSDGPRVAPRARRRLQELGGQQ